MERRKENESCDALLRADTGLLGSPEGMQAQVARGRISERQVAAGPGRQRCISGGLPGGEPAGPQGPICMRACLANTPRAGERRVTRYVESALMRQLMALFKAHVATPRRRNGGVPAACPSDRPPETRDTADIPLVLD